MSKLKRTRERELERQMAGERESSASSILCPAEYELSRLTACQSERPEGQDLVMAALSPPLCLWYLSLYLRRSISCVQPKADLSPPPCFPCLSSTKQARGGEEGEGLPPAANVSPIFHVLISSDSNHCLLAHFALVMSKSSSHILEWLDN